MHLYSAHRSKTNTIKNTKPETLILIYKLSLWEILAEKSFMHVYRTLFLKSAKNEEDTKKNNSIQLSYTNNLFIQLHIIN